MALLRTLVETALATSTSQSDAFNGSVSTARFARLEASRLSRQSFGTSMMTLRMMLPRTPDGAASQWLPVAGRFLVELLI